MPNILEEANQLVTVERQLIYGHPLDDFTSVVRASRALGINPLDGPKSHALYMVLVKLSRLSATPDHRDSLIDIAGYARTYEMILDKEKENAN